MNNSFIQEAFRQVYLTEDAEELSLDAVNPDNTESFLDMVNGAEDDEMISDVYDLEAEAKEDLKQSYIGKVILDCNVCHSNVFFDKEEITQDEDGICCTDVECPYCMSNEGYTIIGEVKPYQEEEDVDIEDIETEEVPEEEPIEDIDEEPIEEEDLKENLNESIEAPIVYTNSQKVKEIDEAEDWEYEDKYFNALDMYGPFIPKQKFITKIVGTNGSPMTYDELCNYLEEDEDNYFDLKLEESFGEGLKADEVKELRGDEEINGADGPIAAVDELEGSDEIRGPKYTELNEAKKQGTPWVVESDVDGEIARVKTEREAKATISELKREDKKLRKGKKVEYSYRLDESLDECGDPEAMEEGLLGAAGGAIAGHAVGSAIGHPVLGTIGGAIAGNAIQNHFSDDKNESLNECGDQEDMEEMEEGVAGWAAGRTAGQAVGTAVGSLGGPVGATVGRVVGGMVGGKLGSAAQDKLSEECEEEMEEGLISGDTSINIGNGNFSGNSILSGNKLGVGGILGKQEMNEDIEDVSINTEDENITMTTKEDGGVVVETSPKEDELVEEPFEGEEMIAPLEPETEVDVEDAIEVNSEDEEEVPEEDEFDFEEEPTEGEEDFEEFDEESFDNLGESYLKRCYENVTSFKTSNITLNENKEFVIEGKIGFDSGNKKDTQFIFKPKTSDNGKLKLEGYNKQISKGKKTFKLNCSVNNKALVCESLNYNYKGKNDLNESVRVYGTVKRK